MDPNQSLAASSVAALAPYLAKAGEEFAKETGKMGANKIGVLYQVLKVHFMNKPAANEALLDLEANPNDEDAQAALRLQLSKQLQADSTLTDTLLKLLDDIKKDQSSITFLTEVYGGTVGQIINSLPIGSTIFEKATSQRPPGDPTTDAPPPEDEEKKKRKGS
jgi:hypothetical protein